MYHFTPSYFKGFLAVFCCQHTIMSRQLLPQVIQHFLMVLHNQQSNPVLIATLRLTEDLPIM